ncbi:hypothetical protein BASA50_009127 [Batrachochytrium salamandrivorans]|uniref:Major facilitator superfamily (MFS) profile domain-containing protein n=1 Tax=Batrachochytrium salamandrivorans TaxID=1357716 RepID=A0ABQ8F2X1_9FUNG|nr:hypothetical protein BASA61_000003 [Batrachochytrium salamandrivorans]KAH6591125.1 hypothetical protein BASA50_009127 [Batrachochytrium salamandrivorans]KAH9247317.1 hypothetical protein BASA81_015084 [Batrachochytrium salamandrivorans]KAH9277399.1 hypothetical protein BASA83_000269 [Batrachochytrium salamandrivorans]
MSKRPGHSDTNSAAIRISTNSNTNTDMSGCQPQYSKSDVAASNEDDKSLFINSNSNSDRDSNGSTSPASTLLDRKRYIPTTARGRASENLLDVDIESIDNSSDLVMSCHTVMSDGLDQLLEFDVVSNTISEIGMGTYQWKLFWLCGMGWVADNMWLQGIASALPKFQREFDLSDTVAGLGITSVFVGMIFGAAGWGVVSDIIGRRPAFSYTLLLAGICGTLSAFSPSFPILCAAFTSLALGVGGNLPVDGTLFLEFTPTEHQNLLTLMSIFWPVGQVLVSIIAMFVIPSNSCPDTGPCDAAQNRGWRLLLFTIGIITLLMVVFRILFFRMLESPKFLLAAGRRGEALAVLHELARCNGKVITLDFEDLSVPTQPLAIQRKSKYGWDKITPLFLKNTRLTTILVWLIWALVSTGYTMFNGFLTKFLKLHGGQTPLSDIETYHNYAIISLFGVPGSILGTYAVETHLGRIGTMSLATLGTSLSLGLFTIFTSSNGQMAVSCVESLLQNTMYGVIYAYTPEVFRTESRSTAVGIASSLSRITGAAAPVITGALLEWNLNFPLYLSSFLIFLAFLCMIMLPIETRGRVAH